MFARLKNYIQANNNTGVSQTYVKQHKQLPTLWLLGKTGAGKSSLVQALTGLSSIEVGNGFAPCTKSACEYDFPSNKPVMKFIDTRGLGEVDYNPSEDLAQIPKHGCALVVLMKADDPEQSAVLSALSQIKIQIKQNIKNKLAPQTVKAIPLLLVHTAVLSVNKHDRERLALFNEKKIEDVWDGEVSSVSVDFEALQNTVEKGVYNQDGLVTALAKILPIIDLLLEKTTHHSEEIKIWQTVKNEVLWYSGSAAASDLVPALGLVSVPAIQAKMLHSIAKRFDLSFSSQLFSELVASLGSSFALQYSTRLGARQMAKFIPIYGQTAGALAASSMSFATTFALGRVACYFFYSKQRGEVSTKQDMQLIYKNALMQGKSVADENEN